MIRLILFDLDGTFVDTALDLIESANEIYKNNNKLNIPYEAGREIASDGINAFLKYRFDEQEDNFDLLSKEYLNVYNQKFLNHPLLFEGIQLLLKGLESNGVKWGIVTNKARYFAENIIKHHSLTEKCSVLMCGDDEGFNPKPSPDLLLESCRFLDINISDALYVGDANRDILSAKSAKIKSVLACYGYLKKSDLIDDWDADYLIHSPLEILDLDILALNNSLS
jgi:2-phosphoglycolate phosphatase